MLHRIPQCRAPQTPRHTNAMILSDRISYLFERRDKRDLILSYLSLIFSYRMPELGPTPPPPPPPPPPPRHRWHAPTHGQGRPLLLPSRSGKARSRVGLSPPTLPPLLPPPPHPHRRCPRLGDHHRPHRRRHRRRRHRRRIAAVAAASHRPSVRRHRAVATALSAATVATAVAATHLYLSI